MNPDINRSRDRYAEYGVQTPAGLYGRTATRHLSQCHAGHEARMAEHARRAQAAGAVGFGCEGEPEISMTDWVERHRPKGVQRG